MKAAIIGWLLFALLLAALGHILGPHVNNISDDDAAFAREYAGEMLLYLEQIALEADKHAGERAPADYYLDAAAELDHRKQAAVHLKGDLAVDFVYAFACAEEWCRASAAALRRPHDDIAARRAREAFARARAEFTAIGSKDYQRR
jgi:hypothetical protein